MVGWHRINVIGQFAICANSFVSALLYAVIRDLYKFIVMF